MTPIIKNGKLNNNVAKGEIPIEKNVIVTDMNGNVIGATYPKRAKGLIKNGRADLVSDGIICLNTLCPPINNKLEDVKMSNRIYFNAREWSFNKACDKNVGERCFINGIDGNLVEVYTIGDWNNRNWTEIISKPTMLEKNADYSICFWLNGGENDRSDEVCQLRVVFDGNHEDCLIYKLNRGYIKPLKKYKGWELYDITFNAGDNDLTQLKFVAQTAYMAIQPAKAPEEYADMEDVVDEFEDMRPQRHNIVFEDGWPATGWYSTKELRKKKEADSRKADTNQNFGFNFGKGFGKQSGFNKAFGANFTDFSQSADNNTKTDSGIHINGQSLSDLMDDIKDHLKEELNMEDIIQTVKDEIADDIVDSIKDDIDIDAIKKEIKDSIRNA